MVDVHKDSPSKFEAAKRIKLVLTDCDGVLTDNGIFYSDEGEAFKRFSFRDGMGVERLRSHGLETLIVTREDSAMVRRRAEKLKMKDVFLGILNKKDSVEEIMKEWGLSWSEIAYMGDDVNDLEVLQLAGLSAAPRDAMPQVTDIVDVIVQERGGYGAFRSFAEWIIEKRSI